MENQLKCNPDAKSWLEYKGLAIVYFQIFTLMDECSECDVCKIGKMLGECKYIKPKLPKEAIDNQIFIYSKNISPVKKYKLDGFSFKLTLKEPTSALSFTDDGMKRQDANISISGIIKVEMSVFSNKTVSLSYRMVIDDPDSDNDKKVGYVQSMESLNTDHLISLVSLFMDAEHWGVEEAHCKQCGSGNVKEIVEKTFEDKEGVLQQYYQCADCGYEFYDDFEYGSIAPELDDGLEITELFLDSNGNWNSDSARNIESLEINCRKAKQNRLLNHTHFKEVSRRYKESVIRMRSSSGCSNSTGGKASLTDKADTAYVFIDIWESFLHDGKCICAGEEEELVAHIIADHKRELVGLMSLYPSEWPYRTDESYDDVCGRNIAIDTDDLVLANQKVCVVFGAYGVRGEEAATDWAEVLKSRRIFHVSWPEYMSILEILLIKKHTIEYADEILLDSIMSGNAFKNPTDAIKENAEMQLSITKMMAKLDAVKHIRFVSHKIMHDRTNKRFEIDEARADLAETVERVDGSLSDIRDAQSIKQGKLLNFILAGISVASLCQIMFAEPNIPFLKELLADKQIFNMNNSHNISVILILFASLLFVIAVGIGIGYLAYMLHTGIANRIKRGVKKWKTSKSGTLN